MKKSNDLKIKNEITYPVIAHYGSGDSHVQKFRPRRRWGEDNGIGDDGYGGSTTEKMDNGDDGREGDGEKIK
ncbi:hypothetical protein Tco_1321904, partial [Tanacetum coccineum]